MNPGGACVTCELVDQPALADTRFAADEEQTALPSNCLVESHAQHFEFPCAPQERPVRARPLGSREWFFSARLKGTFGNHQSVRCRDEIECGILGQDVSLEIVQGPAGLDAEHVDEFAARALVRRERLCLPARAIESQHLRGTDPLAQRMLLCERRELADELRMASQLQLCGDTFLEHTETQFLETRDRRLREGVVGEIRKRRPAPQTQCFAQPHGGDGGFGARGLLAQPFKTVEVELLPLQAQLVSGRARRDCVCAKAPPQLGDIHVHALGRSRGRVRAPDVIDQSIGGNDLVRVYQQDAESSAGFSARQRHRALVAYDLQRPQDAKVKPARHHARPNASVPPSCPAQSYHATAGQRSRVLYRFSTARADSRGHRQRCLSETQASLR